MRGVVNPPDPREAISGAVEPQPDPFDFSLDPILQRILAVGVQSRQQAQAEATRAQADLDLEYGVGAAGSVNPYSTLAKLAEREKKAPGELDESLGSTLFYSGTRATRQSDLAKALLESRTGAAGAYRRGTEGIGGALRERQLGFDRDELAAQQAAADRRIEQLRDLPAGRPAPAVVPALRRAAPRRQVRRQIGGGY